MDNCTARSESHVCKINRLIAADGNLLPAPTPEV
jgi:hypothetical protein